MICGIPPSMRIISSSALYMWLFLLPSIFLEDMRLKIYTPVYRSFLKILEMEPLPKGLPALVIYP